MTTTMVPARDVILRDGSTLRLHAPEQEDGPALLAFFEALSPESAFQRFHGFPSLAPELVEPFLAPDWRERGSLIGSLGQGAEARIVALASYVRLRDPTSAEVAFAVADELQGHGVGTRLLEQLSAFAAREGIEQFLAIVMAGNRPMLRVFEDAGFRLARQIEGGEIEVRLDIEPTGTYVAHVDERDHVAVAASLAPFFAPRTVAVVGASSRRGSIGGELYRNVLEGGFGGAAYPVNLKGEPVAGVHAFRSIADIPDEIDLAVLCVAGEHVLEAAEDALSAGTKALCVISAGFAEVGSEGARRQDALVAAVRAHGARLIGPNCLGIAVSAVSLNATFGPSALPPGRVAVSSQSGALGLALLEAADGRGLGLSAFVSIGNKADVSSNDLLEFWEDDPQTSLVVLYLESFGNPRKFARLARRVARTKPILALKGGRTTSGARASRSHTAALAGSETAVDALFRQAGVIRADTLEELIDVAALLSTQPLPRGRRTALLTNAGGLGILAADACEAAGLELPMLSEATREALSSLLPREASLANPVDMLGSATEETFEAALPARAARSGHRFGDRALCPTRRRRSRRSRRGGGRRGRAGGESRQARARRLREPRGDAGRLAARAAPRGCVPVSRVGGARARPGGRARRVAPSAGRAQPGDRRDRPDSGRGSRPRGARRIDGCLAPAGPGAGVARGLPGAGRRGAGRRLGRRRRWPPPSRSASPSSSRPPRRERTRATRASLPSTWPTRRPCVRPSRASASPRSCSRWPAAAPSCLPASSRIPCSARSSRSGRGACSPS